MTHDVMDDLLVKIKDPESQNSKKQRKDKRFKKQLDQLMLNQKNIVDDLEKYCTNKRLKKNCYKLDLL